MNKKTNVILITIDSLRADHLRFMGYNNNVSPNLNEFSKDCAIFTNAFAVGPNTPYSFPSILTATYPLDFQGPKKIEKPRIFISEVLKKEGFITAAFHSNPRLSDFFGYNQGWDFFEDVTLPSEIRQNRDLKSMFRDFLYRFGEPLCSIFPELYFGMRYLLYKFSKPKTNFKIKASYLNQIVKNFIESVKDEQKPFFAWIHYMDVHGPYLPFEFYTKDKALSFSDLIGKALPTFFSEKKSFPLKRFIKKHFQNVISLYDQGIRYVDQEIGDLLKFLKKENLYHNSIIFLTSDHGEEFLEHGEGSHNNKLYNELLSVPLLVKISENKNKVIKEKVSLIDIPVTICDILKIKRPPAFKGKNLFDDKEEFIFHQTGAPKEKKNFYWDIDIKSHNQCVLSCQNDQWKYIIDYSEGKEELYNLKKDPKEKENLSKTESKTLFLMRKEIQEFEKQNPPLSLLK